MKKQLLTILAVLLCVEVVVAKGSPTQSQIVDTGVSTQSGEYFLYSKVIDTYRNKQIEELRRAVALMLKAYPRSVHADNALFLEADLALEKRQHQRAVDAAEQLIVTYPFSNKRVSALYLKAQALSEMKQSKDASAAIAEIKSKYPGSIEAAKSSPQRITHQ